MTHFETRLVALIVLVAIILIPVLWRLFRPARVVEIGPSVEDSGLRFPDHPNCRCVVVATTSDGKQYEFEAPTKDDCYKASIDNWSRVPPKVRARCISVLRDALAEHADIVSKWRGQVVLGSEPGCDDPHFHFGAGMAIRNILRAALTDDLLPPVDYPGGHTARNWDDYYLGALVEFLREPIEKKTRRLRRPKRVA